MLADEHLSVAALRVRLKPTVSGPTDPIKGGIAVTYRDSERKLGPIGFFAKHPELNTILHKVRESGATFIDSGHVRAVASYRYTQKMHEDHPEASRTDVRGDAAISCQHQRLRAALVPLPRRAGPTTATSTCSVLGVIKNKRVSRWIRSDYITGPESFDKYKVAVPAANGSGSTTDFFGVALNNPTVLEPGVAVTQTFITIGSFDTEAEAQACLKYVKSKFARTMLGVLKITQHNPAKHVEVRPGAGLHAAPRTSTGPSRSREIDQQLYAKYGLDPEEIAFIEAKVKPMD